MSYPGVGAKWSSNEPIARDRSSHAMVHTLSTQSRDALHDYAGCHISPYILPVPPALFLRLAEASILSHYR
jgi:hypothetical protein